VSIVATWFSAHSHQEYTPGTQLRRYQFKEIAVAINQNCLEAALEKMAGAALSPVDPASIAKGEVLQTAL
jgi:hypothetical protein